jgi:phospholipid-binding lipoprotein MlaA
MILSIICGFTSVSLADKGSKDKYSYDYAALNNRCQVYDPYESLNRKIFFVNGVLDTLILRSIAKGYGRFTSYYTKQRVGSFVDNISEPLSTVNYFLQGNSNGMFKTFWRFTINSTFGILGLFDVASKFGLTAEPQTFGNTLGYYGVGSGPYIVLPLIGGTTGRDVMDPLLLNSLLNPINTMLIPANYQMHRDFKNVVTGVRVVHKREMTILFTDRISKNSPDPYVAIRDAIIQQREAKMDYPAGFKCPIVNNQ